MRFLIIFLFLLITITTHASEKQLQALCFAYNGISDKPIANVIFAANKDGSSGCKTEMLGNGLLQNKKFYIDFFVSSKELKSFESEKISKKEKKEGNLIIVFYYADSLKVCKYSISEGLKVVRTFLMLIDYTLRQEVQEVFVDRIDGMIGNLNP